LPYGSIDSLKVAFTDFGSTPSTPTGTRVTSALRGRAGEVLPG